MFLYKYSSISPAPTIGSTRLKILPVIATNLVRSMATCSCSQLLCGILSSEQMSKQLCGAGACGGCGIVAIRRTHRILRIIALLLLTLIYVYTQSIYQQCQYKETSVIHTVYVCIVNKHQNLSRIAKAIWRTFTMMIVWVGAIYLRTKVLK